uniref:ADF-H domain-containing protein n=1 Tax=Aureoumbra lagunensis TaxID=44058 RepID=A0A7S3JWX5_9STRA|mmetsp:Transcript_3824/g.5331  ORF Transcript_3824/g.5331 Transcript_3824/m.5331 type:complete len:138 (+) Transcript_3824:105-518(+)
MATGISVSDSVVSKFDDFKLKRMKDVKFITMVIEGTEVVLEKEYPKSMTMADFQSELDDSPKYIVVDYDYTTLDGRPADKIILISWIPDTAKIKEKMKYSGTKEAVKSALQGIAVNINATDKSECTEDELTAACTRI